MFLRKNRRVKSGKDHYYWNIVENRRLPNDKVVQRQVLYLGEINDSQRWAWRKSIEAFSDESPTPQTLALFPEDRAPEVPDDQVVRIRMDQLQVRRPRQFGACWLAGLLYCELRLDWLWAELLPRSRKGTPWDLVLQTLVTYRLIAPGSEWRLHRQWFDSSAMADILEEDFGLVEIHKLYECLDKLLVHKTRVLRHLRQRWEDLYSAKFDVLLYDLTSTYFESNPPFGPDQSLRQYGYSRDKRSDCVQVILAMVVTPDGLPMAYEVMRGNTSDRTTLRGFLDQIEAAHGKANRIWIMDRGIPTEEVLHYMRQEKIGYLVGTPRGQLTKMEADFLGKPWQEVRPEVSVKLRQEDGDTFVMARSRDRQGKEQAMRRRKMKNYRNRLKELAHMDLTRDDLLKKLGAAEKEATPKVAALWTVKVEEGNSGEKPRWSFVLRREVLRTLRRREGVYLLRTNLEQTDPKVLWEYYLQLVEVEQSFKDLKGDLGIRPIYHQLDERIEAHIFVAFLAYCLHAQLRVRVKNLAPGLTPRSILDKLGTISMVDVHLPTTDNRTVILRRHTVPEPDVAMLLARMRLTLPEQPPPRVTNAQVPSTPVV